MKAYGIKRGDIGHDCTSSNKFGGRAIKQKCSCGLSKKKSRPRKHSSAHRERRINYAYILLNN